jgi:hypothetical protein
VLGGAARWLLFSEEGARWALDRLPWVQATGFQGALLGDRWQAEKLVVRIPGGTTESVTLEGLDAQGLRWVWRPHEHAWIGLHLRQLDVRRLTRGHRSPGPRPLPLPDSLAWPLHLQLVQARVQVLQIDQLEAIHDLQAQNLELDPRPGGRHSVQAAGATWYALRLQARPHRHRHAAAAGRAGHAAPGAGRRRAGLGRGAARQRRRAQSAGHRHPARRAATGRDAPALDAEAQLQVLQRWPLAGLKLQTRNLDLSALEVRAPPRAWQARPNWPAVACTPR